MSEKNTLSDNSRRDRIESTGKGHEESIPLCIDLVPVIGLEGCTQQVATLGQHTGIAITQLLEQMCGSLDVSEEQRHRSLGQVRHRHHRLLSLLEISS
jgi:hypothetical protein